MFLFETTRQEVGCTIIASAIRYNTFPGFDKCMLGVLYKISSTRRNTLSRQNLSIRSKGKSFTLQNSLCTGVGYGKSVSPFHRGSTGASPGKIVIWGFLKSAFQCIAFE